MNATKYFKPGQKILLRPLQPTDEQHQRDETLTVFFQDSGLDHLDLSLNNTARNDETYPFAHDMSVELSTDALGIGIRLNGTFDRYLEENLIRVNIEDNVRIFQRRVAHRLDHTIGLRYTKGNGSLRTFRRQWEKNVQILADLRDTSSLPPFPQTEVNLSAGGIRFAIKTPVEVSDLCLTILDLRDGAAPACALAEVVWLGPEEADDRRVAGMRFISILNSDQKRIERLIRNQKT